MSATDSCEPQVIIALKKEGWIVEQRQFRIRLGFPKRFGFVDLLLQKALQHILIVEIKCFSNISSILDEFYHVAGQYMVYREGLDMRGLNEPLFLCIPLEAYHGLTKYEAVMRTLKNAKINLIIVDLNLEEIVQWIQQP